ncbi:MAG: hypothetical protein ACKO24_13290 [Leptolyngbyaceae cyanobacterium]
MRGLNVFWSGLWLLGQQSPPQLIEAVMLLLAIPLSLIWYLLHSWPCLVLSLSYIVGAIASILVRESISPSSHSQTVRMTAILSLLLLLSGVGLYLAKAGNHSPFSFSS